ncbi:MAG: AMP-binding protein [Actinomycetota bacterium]
MTVALREHADQRGDEWSLDDGAGRITWAEENERTNRLIHGLRNLGLRAGDTVAILGGNRREWVEAASAASYSSLVFVPVNWHFSVDEAAYVLSNSGAQAMIADVEYRDTAHAAAERAGLDVRVAYGGSIDGFTDYDDLLAASSPAEPVDQGAGRPMFYTSGTTGRPKGVVPAVDTVGDDPRTLLQQRVDRVVSMQIPTDDGIAYNGAPLYHAGPLVFAYIPHDAGSRLILRRKWNAAEMLALIESERITTAYAVPTHFARLLKLPDEVRHAHDLSSLRTVWHTAAPCPPDVKRRMIEWWGPVIYELYGASEGGPGGTSFTCTSEEWLAHPGTVGKPNPNTEVHILDDDNNDLAPNEVGQIYVRSRNGGDFKYLSDDDKTASVHLAPGMYSFGDIGYMDDDGFLHLSDRQIDMIVSGGVNIYPAEIEAALFEHELVADCSVFGIPNDDFGEEVKAAVELVDGADPAAAEAPLKRHCREKLAGYKVPRSFDFGPLPRTATGKLPKRLVRARYWEGTGRSI